jgi:trehalose 6-phosphate synthase
MTNPSLLVASNRGPISFRAADDGSLSMSRGGGGLVSGLSALDSAAEVLWVCAALTDADRRAAREAPGGRLDLAGHDTGGQAIRMLGIDPATLHRAYNEVANSTLWFVHHLLFDTPTKPRFDAGFRREWTSYVDYNRTFAEALAADAAQGAKVLVQDYHLTLAPQHLRELRPDLRIAHFSHTPWAPVDYFAMLPDDVAREVLTGVLGADHVGFHSPRWAEAFAHCCARLLGASVTEREATYDVTYDGRTSRVAVHPLGVDADFMRSRAAQPDVEARLAMLREQVGDRRVIVRVDRTELSKNIVRGLHAYRELLRRYPQWHAKVTHLALAYPSRHDLPEYREYTAAVQRLAVEIDDEFSTPDWRALDLRVDDDFARSLACYRIADVLLVNPLRDGMNLVAKEVPVVSDGGCALVLSHQAGAADEFSADAFMVNPYDVSGTADALDAALRLPAEDRRARSDRLARIATAAPPQRWFTDQVDALDEPPD